MPTETQDKPEVKKENFATVQEALEGAGTTVLSHLGSLTIDPKSRPTEEEVKAYIEENQPQVLGYGGPYTDVEDQRNTWTKYQLAPEDEIPTTAKRQLEIKKKQEEDLAAALTAIREDAEEE